MKETYRASTLGHIFENNGKYALFHSLTYEVLYFDDKIKSVLDLFEHGSTVEFVLNKLSTDLRSDARQVITELIENNFLIPVNKNEFQEIHNAADRLVGYPEISILYLLLTGRCNLRCKYCFVETPHIPTSFKSAMMTKETAILGIDTYAKALASNPENKLLTRNVYYYGGEPILNWDTLVSSAEYMLNLKEKGILPETLVLNMVTNGTLITKEMAHTLARLGIQVSVSLDGPQEITEKNRGKPNGGSKTYDSIIAGIKNLQYAGITVGISCTISDNEDSLPEIVRWFNSELGVSSLGFNVLMGNEAEIGVTKEYFKKAAHGMLAAYEVARELNVYEDRVTRKVRAFSEQILYPKDCGGCGRQIVVTADGLVGPCHAYAGDGQDYYKKLTDSYNPVTDPDILEWSERSPLTMAQCQTRSAVGICGGGCAYHADRNYGSIWAIDDRFCYQAKSTVEWLVWDLYKQND